MFVYKILLLSLIIRNDKNEKVQNVVTKIIFKNSNLSIYKYNFSYLTLSNTGHKIQKL